MNEQQIQEIGALARILARDVKNGIGMQVLSGGNDATAIVLIHLNPPGPARAMAKSAVAHLTELAQKAASMCGKDTIVFELQKNSKEVCGQVAEEMARDSQKPKPSTN